jgi:hypothetical protein
MIRLYDKESGALLGTITDEQLEFLADELEEESDSDQDYYINETTVDMFEETKADPALVAMLRRGLNGRSEMEIRWSRD